MDYSLPASSVHGIFQARVWSGLPFHSPGDLPDPGIELESPAFQADALPSAPPVRPNRRIEAYANEVVENETVLTLLCYQRCMK